jgi:hypothetical protein
MSRAMANKRSKKFDYRTLPHNVRSAARDSAERIRDLIRKEEIADSERLIAAIETGIELVAIQDKLDHGLFLDWIGTELGMTSRTAERYQRLAEVFGGIIDTVSSLGLTRGHLLAAPSTPEVVRTGVVERLKAGEVPSTKEIRDMISTTKTVQKRLEEAQKRLEEERLRKETAIEITEIADAVVVGSENDGSEKPVTEPPIGHEVVNETPPTVQAKNNTAEPAAGSSLADAMGDDTTSGEPVGGRRGSRCGPAAHRRARARRGRTRRRFEPHRWSGGWSYS